MQTSEIKYTLESLIPALAGMKIQGFDIKRQPGSSFQNEFNAEIECAQERLEDALSIMKKYMGEIE